MIAVEPKSRLELRELAHKIRKALGLEPDKPFPAVQILELLQFFTPDAYFEVVPKDEMPQSIHADTDIVHKVIRIREDVYDGACSGNGRDRMTIVHEFCHFMMLCVCGFKLTRVFCNEIEKYRDPEWQAKCFAGELMMDSRAIQGMDPSSIAITFGVSEEAASLQLKKI